MSLEQRIERLEQAAGLVPSPLVLFADDPAIEQKRTEARERGRMVLLVRFGTPSSGTEGEINGKVY